MEKSFCGVWGTSQGETHSERSQGLPEGGNHSEGSGGPPRGEKSSIKSLKCVMILYFSIELGVVKL